MIRYENLNLYYQFIYVQIMDYRVCLSNVPCLIRTSHFLGEIKAIDADGPAIVYLGSPLFTGLVYPGSRLPASVNTR